MSLNTKVAYPYTRSNRVKDKILSEVMISELIKSVSPDTNFWIDDERTKLILDGYYFELNQSPNMDYYVYCFTQIGYNSGGIIQKEEFPQLLNYISMSDSGNLDEMECLFLTPNEITEESPETAFDFIHHDEYGYYYGEHYYINVIGGKISDIPLLKDIYASFYISENYDNSKRYKIWIKQSTMNPYVYLSDDNWCPLGAVYKTSE